MINSHIKPNNISPLKSDIAMKKQSILLFALLMITLHLFGQKNVGGVQVKDKIESEGTTLLLNGAGVREKYFIDLYVAALYTKEKSKDANKILDGNEPLVMKIEIVSSRITKDNMSEAIRDGFSKATKGNQANYQSKIDEFVNALSQDIKKGNKYEVVYNPTTESLKVFKDGTLKTTIKGKDFKKIVFAIWLGSNPVDSDLKNDLLGK